MIEELYPRFVTYQGRLKKACCYVRYLLLLSIFLATALFYISKNNIPLFVYINYHYSLRYICPDTFFYVPVILLLLHLGSTSRLFIDINYNASKAFRKESKKEFAIRQARYSCGTWFSWSFISIVFIFIALSSICFSPDSYGWMLYFYYTVFVFLLNYYFYRSFCRFFKNLEEFAGLSVPSGSEIEINKKI